MPRLKIGDHVRILPTMASPFVDLEGTIKEILPSNWNLSVLDRYNIILSWGEEQSFYDAQLAMRQAQINNVCNQRHE
jgi:hypothetical protein